MFLPQMVYGAACGMMGLHVVAISRRSLKNSPFAMRRVMVSGGGFGNREDGEDV